MKAPLPTRITSRFDVSCCCHRLAYLMMPIIAGHHASDAEAALPKVRTGDAPYLPHPGRSDGCRIYTSFESAAANSFANTASEQEGIEKPPIFSKQTLAYALLAAENKRCIGRTF